MRPAFVNTNPFMAEEAALNALLPHGAVIDAVRVIATPKELERPEVQRRLADLKTQLPSMTVFRARPVGPGLSLTAAPSLRTRYSLSTKERHSHEDINAWGAVGCADSHAQLLREAAQRPPENWTLILEWDAVPNKILTGWPRLPNADPPGMVNMGLNKGDAVPVAPGFVSPKGLWMSTHALLVRNGAAGAYANAIATLEAHVDRQLAMAHALGEVPPIWIVDSKTPPIGYKSVKAALSTVHIRGATHTYLKARLPADDVALGFIIITPYVAAGILLVLAALMLAFLWRRHGSFYVPRSR